MMQMRRKLRGLLGTALIWAVFGAFIGLPLFFVAFPPWLRGVGNWARYVRVFGGWELATCVWGGAVGLIFGVIVLINERRRTFSELSAARISLYGGIAGMVFPVLLFSRQAFAGSSLGLFLLMAGLSVVAGALWARVSFGLARRHALTAPVSTELPQVNAGAMPRLDANVQRSRPHDHVIW